MKNPRFVPVLVLLIVGMFLVGCGGAAEIETVVVTKVIEGETVEVIVTVTPEAEPVTLYENIGMEPPTLDPALVGDTVSSGIVTRIFSGLTDIDDETQEVVPAMATSWSSSDDKKTWTFELRDDVPWVRYDTTLEEIQIVKDEEGNPRMVTADDFVYGIKRTCDPRTATDYAWLLYVIRGCKELNVADPSADNFKDLYEAMAVVALDDNTLEITLEYGAGYFPAIVTMSNLFPTYQPIIEDKGDRWIEAGFIVTNGAYVLKEWVHGDHIIHIKNPYWPMWGTTYAPGNIEKLVGYMIESTDTEFLMYENNEIDYSYVPAAQIERVKSDPVLSEEYYQAPVNCTGYYGFVTQKPPVDDPRVRRALSMTIDRKTIVDAITKRGQIPANTFTNPLSFGSSALDPQIAPWALEESKGGTGYTAAVENARELLAEAGYPDGEGLEIQLMFYTFELTARVAQATQAMWLEAFPEMAITVENQEWRVYLDTIDADTDIRDVPHVFRLGWCGDYPHANNWLHEVFNTEEGANRVRMSHEDPQVGHLVKEYDEVTKAAQTADDDVALELYKRAEQLLIEEIVAITPIWYSTSTLVTKPYLQRTYDPIKTHNFQWYLDQAAQMEARR